MSDTLIFLGNWSHVLAAILFAALAIWIGRRMASAIEGKLLVAALSLTATWALSIAFSGVDMLSAGLVGSLRDCAWLTTLFALPWEDSRPEHRRPTGFTIVYAVLVAVLLMQSMVDILWSDEIAGSDRGGVVVEGGLILRMIWMSGALLLMQRIFASAAPSRRSAIGPVMAAMSAMWAYDLLLYISAYFGASWTATLYALRGGMMAGLVPVIALAARTADTAPIKPSRTLATWGLGLAAVLGVSAVILSSAAFVHLIPSPAIRATVTGGIFAMAVAALVVLPSQRFRSLFKVMVAKHFFQHRYDYRAQWMNFADTIGQTIRSDATLYERAIKAVADITESPSGLLLLIEDGNRLTVHGQWNWPDDASLGAGIEGDLVQALQQQYWVVDIDRIRANADMAPSLPPWIADNKSAWALVPIIHFGALTGALLLARPTIDRALDWEDYDMLRTAGRQVASYIAEAQGQQALADARRFDEFNRRFAFIMHDIKNLVSQLSLLSRNAERHADNPEFRADMVLTLQDSVGKMNDMLARLSQHNNGEVRDPIDFTLGALARAVGKAKGRAHPVLVDGNLGLMAHADPARVEQIVVHLVQNAIDASTPEAPVTMHITEMEGFACLSIIDQGCGMTPEFMRNELFRPFSSSKPGGFGIGAFEARELAKAMRGSLRVESVPGKGSRFTLCLPLAAATHTTSSQSRKERAA